MGPRPWDRCVRLRCLRLQPSAEGGRRTEQRQPAAAAARRPGRRRHELRSLRPVMAATVQEQFRVASNPFETAARLPEQLLPVLGAAGYELVARGPNGLTWERQSRGRAI